MPKYIILIYSKLAILCILLLNLFSCQKKENQKLYNINLNENLNKIKTINLDSLSSSSANYVAFFSDTIGQTLYFLNLLNNGLEEYEWNSGKFVKKIKLENSGPNGVGKATGFFVKSRDSILIVSGSSHKVSLIDSKSKLIKSFSLLMGDNQSKEILGTGIISYGDEANNMATWNGHFYACASPFDDPAKESYYANGHYGLDLNLDNSKVSTIMPAPDHWKDKFKDGYRFTAQESFYGQDYNLSKGTCVISYLVESYIYEVDLATRKVIKHEAKSDFINEVAWMKRSMDISDTGKELQFFVDNHFYPSIFYDRFREVYFRFVAHPNPKKKERRDNHPLVVFSIVVLDKNFKKISEKLLDESYPSTSMIITHEAVYIKKLNADENKISFVPFDLE